VEATWNYTMSGIICSSCQRIWRVSVPESVYLQMELLSRPCPYCEACTLSLCVAATARLAGPFRRTWRPRNGSHPAGPLVRGQG
jgi:hypothetical protein